MGPIIICPECKKEYKYSTNCCGWYASGTFSMFHFIHADTVIKITYNFEDWSGRFGISDFTSGQDLQSGKEIFCFKGYMSKPNIITRIQNLLAFS